MALQKAGVQLIVEGDAAATAALTRFGQAVTRTADQTHAAGGRVSGASQIMIGALRQVGAVATDMMLRAGRAVIGFGVESVKAAGDFQQGMSVLQAVTGATEGEMAKLQKTAIALGNDISLPATSASDAAEAMTELAKAGLSVEQAMDAAKGTLQLATAAEVDNAKAAQIVAGALNAFHLEGGQAVQVADLLAAAANASSASMTDLSQGLQQGGFMFNATGQKVDDLVASLAILTNVGLTGSDAGTALKNAMTRLVNPTDKASKLMSELGINVFDAQGKMLPFRDIIGVLNQSLAGMTDEQRLSALSTIFLSDGMKAMLPLLDAGVTGFEAMKEKVNQQGAAAQLAGAQTAGFNGAIAAAKNAAETLGLTIGLMLLPPLTDFLNNYVVPGIGWLSGLATAISESNTPLQTFISYVSAANPALAGVVSQITSFINTSPLIQGAMAIIGQAFTSGATPIEGFLNVLSTISPGFAMVRSTAEAVFPSVQALVTAVFGVMSQTVSQHGTQMATDTQTAWTSIQTSVNAVLIPLQGLITAVFGQITIFINAHGTEISTFIATTWGQITNIISTALQIISAIVGPTLSVITGFINTHTTEIQSYFSTAWGLISTLITGTLATIQGILNTTLKLIQGDWEGAWTEVTKVLDTQLKSAEQILKGGLDLLKGAIELSWTAFKEAANGLGSNIIDGILQGIEDGVGALTDAVTNAAQDALDAAKSALGISSPSKDFAKQVGAPMIQGIVQGAQQQASDLSSSITGIVTSAISAAQAPISDVSSIGKSISGQLASGINSGAGAAINAAKGLANRIRDALQVSVGGGGGGGGWSGGGLSLGGGGGGFGGGLSLGGGSIAPAASAAQIHSAGATTINNTQSRTYNYSPTYGGTPRAPSTDFNTMAAWGI